MLTQRTQNSSAHNQPLTKTQQKSIPKNQPPSAAPTIRQVNTKTTSKRTGSNPSNQNLKTTTITLANQLTQGMGSGLIANNQHNQTSAQLNNEQSKQQSLKQASNLASQGQSLPTRKHKIQSASRQNENNNGIVSLQLVSQQNSASQIQSQQTQSNGGTLQMNITPSQAFQNKDLENQNVKEGDIQENENKNQTKQGIMQINIDGGSRGGVANVNIIGITATPVNGQSASSSQKISSLKGVRRVLKSPQNPHSNFPPAFNLATSANKLSNQYGGNGNVASNSIQSSKKSISGGSHPPISQQSQHKSSYLEKQRMSSHLAHESGININKFVLEESKQLYPISLIQDGNPNFSDVIQTNTEGEGKEIKSAQITPQLRKNVTPQTTKNQTFHNEKFFHEEEIKELKELESYYEAAQDLEVKMVNERAAASFAQINISPSNQNLQSQDQIYSDSRNALHNQGSPIQDQPNSASGKVFKRMSLHSKRGRNQPSQNSHHTQTTPTQNPNFNQAQQIYIQNQNLQGNGLNTNQHVQKSPRAAQLLKMNNGQTLQQQQQALQEIIIVNLSKRDDSFYGNDQDIYEYERLGNVMLLNQVKLKEESSLSLLNESNIGGAMINNPNFKILADLDEASNILKSVRSSIKNDQYAQDYISNASLNEMHLLSSKFQTQPAHKQNRFAAIEQELDDSVSRINQSDFKHNPFLLQQRSLSLSSYHNNISHQQSIYNRRTTQIKRPDSSSPLQDFKSMSSGKIMRRDSSTGHLFESPSERTILDVLGLCSSTTHKNNQGGFSQLAPFAGQSMGGQIMIGHDLSEIFHLEAMNQQQSMNLGHGNGQAILMQSQYQNYDLPSRMPSLMFMNQSQSSQNHQILFNNHPGCNGSYTGDSFSTNKIVNNFLDEKRKELEALQEQDRESDTTEQMTFSQNSRDASQDSQGEDLELQSNGGKLQSQLQVKLQHLKQNSKSQLQQQSQEEGELKHAHDQSNNIRQLQRQGNNNQLRKLIAKPSSQKQLIEGITTNSGGMSDLEIKQFSKSNVRAQGYVFSPEVADKSELPQQKQNTQSLSKREKLLTNEAYQEMYGAIGSEYQHQDLDFGGDLEFNKDLCYGGQDYGDEEGAESQLDENGQRRMLRRTSRIFEYYNKSKKDSMSKKKKKRRITSTNGNNNLLSAQSCTRGSNIQMMSIRDILLEKDSAGRNDQHSNLQLQHIGSNVPLAHQLLMTPEEEALQTNCLDQLAENQEKMELKQQRTSKSQRCTQTSFLNRKTSQNPSSNAHPLKQGNTTMGNQTQHELKITSPSRPNIAESYKTNDPLQIQSMNSLDGQSSPKITSDLLSNDVTGQRQPQSGAQKSRNYLFSQTILSNGVQLAQSDSQQQLPFSQQQITLSSLEGSTPNLRKGMPALMSEQHSDGGKHKTLYTPTALSSQPKSVTANQRSHTQNKVTQDRNQNETLKKQVAAREELGLVGQYSQNPLLQINTDDIDSEGPSIKKTNLSQGRKQASNSNQNHSDSSKRNLTLSSNTQSKSTGTHAQQQYCRTMNDNNYLNHKQLLIIQEQHFDSNQRLGKMGSSPSLTQLRLPQSQDQNQIKTLTQASTTPVAKMQGRPSLGGKQKQATSIQNQKQGKSNSTNKTSGKEQKQRAKEAIMIEQEEDKEQEQLYYQRVEAVVNDFERMLSNSNLNQQIANESLPKSHNGSLRVDHLQSCSHQITQNNIDVANTQLAKDMLIAQFEGDLNRTAPDDLSASYMNIGNSTVEMKIQNAANIKTFDFRPSKQPQ